MSKPVGNGGQQLPGTAVSGAGAPAGVSGNSSSSSSSGRVDLRQRDNGTGAR